MTRGTSETRDRIIRAANRMFYAHGIRTVSVDAIAEAAGVTKRTLYYHFRSKDDLIETYMVSRDQPNLAAFKRWFQETDGSVADRVGAIFTNLSRTARHRRWRGCGYLRTAAELADLPGHPAIKAGKVHKQRVEGWLEEVFANAGLETPADLARQIIVLMDGAFSTMLIHHDTAYIDAAGLAARNLLAARLR